jgi:hypothetical protein
VRNANDPDRSVNSSRYATAPGRNSAIEREDLLGMTTKDIALADGGSPLSRLLHTDRPGTEPAVRHQIVEEPTTNR